MANRLSIRGIEDRDVPAVVALWRAAGVTRPWNDPEADIAAARRGAHSTILVGALDSSEEPSDGLIATAMVGEGGHRGWVYYVAVDPAHQRCGIGRDIMKAAERWLIERGVAKLNLLVRSDNVAVRAFYEKRGYERSDVVCLQKVLARHEG